MSRRQFLARMSATGLGLTGFAFASNSVDGEVITTPASGLIAGLMVRSFPETSPFRYMRCILQKQENIRFF